MSRLRPEPSSSWRAIQYSPSPRLQHRLCIQRCVCVSVLLLLLFTQLLSNWFTAPTALAATKPPVASGHLTLSQFLAEQPHAHRSTTPFHFPTPSPQMTVYTQEHVPNYAHPPASAELPTMQPLVIALSSAYRDGCPIPLPVLTGLRHSSCFGPCAARRNPHSDQHGHPFGDTNPHTFRACEYPDQHSKRSGHADGNTDAYRSCRHSYEYSFAFTGLWQTTRRDE